LPPVKGDFGQLQQVFINLIVNAIQAMPGGGELTIQSSSAAAGFIKVSVQDTGCGIPPENMEKLFTPFFSTKDAVKGVGLGLAVSYGIIERHGGRIEVHSQVGHGSTFSVYLPVFHEEVKSPAPVAS
jgi:two-component system, NtrC family, sensor kinase